MAATGGPRTAKPGRRLPIFGGILPFDRSRLPTELIAGATLAALAMPEVMGYSKIAEMPVITGLYTLVLPMLAFAIFGSSRHLVVGADSATAAVLAVGLGGHRSRRRTRLPAMGRHGRARRPHVWRVHDRRSSVETRVHRQLPLRTASSSAS